MKKVIKFFFFLITSVTIGLYSCSAKEKEINQQIETSTILANNQEVFVNNIEGNKVQFNKKISNPKKKNNLNKKKTKGRKKQNLNPSERVKQNSKKFTNRFKTPGIMKILNS